MNRYNQFSIEKIIQVFAYIQKKTGTESKLELIKYLFFADRVNIRRHFSFISRDSYYALKLGPVASNALNVLERNEDYLNYPDSDLRLLEKIELKNRSTRIINETTTDLLNKNEIASIDFVAGTFNGSMRLVELTHEYPEWKRYKEQFDQQLISKENIIIEDFFTNPDINNSPYLKKYFGKDPLFEDETYLAEAKKFYLEEMALNNV